MKKVLGKYAIVGLIVTMLVSLISINYTVQADDGSIDWGAASTFIERGKTSDVGGINSDDLNTIGDSFSEIGQVLTYIGAGVLVGAMAYMGILYMVSPPEKQAKLKQQLIGLVISAVVIFGAYTIWQIIVTLLENVTTRRKLNSLWQYIKQKKTKEELMGTYYIPRNYKGETRILYIFTVRSLITTAIGAGVGALFFALLSAMGAKMVGVIIMAVFALIGWAIGALKIPTIVSIPITKKVGGEPLRRNYFKIYKV